MGRLIQRRAKRICATCFLGLRMCSGAVWIHMICLVLVSVVSAQENVPARSEEVIITDISGSQDMGRVLCASDSSLVLWPSTEPYDEHELDEFAKLYQFSEINRMIVKREGQFWKGFRYGALIGGGAGVIIGLASGGNDGGFLVFSPAAMALAGAVIFGVPSALIGGAIGAAKGVDDDFFIGGDIETYKAVVSKLKEIAMFPSKSPPELQRPTSLDVQELPLAPMQEPSGEISKSVVPPSPARLHISLGGGLIETRANNDVEEAFWDSGFGGTVGGWFGGTVDYPVDHSLVVTWNLAVEYNLTEHFRLGLAWDKIPKQEVHGLGSVYEYARGTSYTLLLEYVGTPAAPRFISRTESAVGAGLSLNSLSVSGRLSSSSPFEIKEEVVGVYVRGSIDHYYSRNVSLQLRLDVRLIPSVDVPEIRSGTKTLQRHSVNFSAVALTLGLRFHF